MNNIPIKELHQTEIDLISGGGSLIANLATAYTTVTPGVTCVSIKNGAWDTCFTDTNTTKTDCVKALGSSFGDGLIAGTVTGCMMTVNDQRLGQGHVHPHNN